MADGLLTVASLPAKRKAGHGRVASARGNAGMHLAPKADQRDGALKLNADAMREQEAQQRERGDAGKSGRATRSGRCQRAAAGGLYPRGRGCGRRGASVFDRSIDRVGAKP